MMEYEHQVWLSRPIAVQRSWPYSGRIYTLCYYSRLKAYFVVQRGRRGQLSLRASGKDVVRRLCCCAYGKTLDGLQGTWSDQSRGWLVGCLYGNWQNVQGLRNTKSVKKIIWGCWWRRTEAHRHKACSIIYRSMRLTGKEKPGEYTIGEDLQTMLRTVGLFYGCSVMSTYCI